MSIPKEPRQLMINLMYLVLTAMLALNVSAEIMNAFNVIDNSLVESTNSANEAITAQETALTNALKDDSKANFRKLSTGVTEIRAASAEFITSVEELKNLLIDDAGNKNGTVDEGDYKYYGEPKQTYKGKKNKDVTTRILTIEGKGEELRANIAATRQKLVDIYRKTLSDPETAKAVGFTKGANAEIDTEAIEAAVSTFERTIVLDTETDEEWKALASDDKKNLGRVPLQATPPRGCPPPPHQVPSRRQERRSVRRVRTRR